MLAVPYGTVSSAVGMFVRRESTSIAPGPTPLIMAGCRVAVMKSWSPLGNRGRSGLFWRRSIRPAGVKAARFPARFLSCRQPRSSSWQTQDTTAKTLLLLSNSRTNVDALSVRYRTGITWGPLENAGANPIAARLGGNSASDAETSCRPKEPGGCMPSVTHPLSHSTSGSNRCLNSTNKPGIAGLITTVLRSSPPCSSISCCSATTDAAIATTLRLNGFSTHSEFPDTLTLNKLSGPPIVRPASRSLHKSDKRISPVR